MAEGNDDREARVREELWRRNIMLMKSRLKGSPHADDRGGYMLVDVDTNNVIAGAKYELDIEEVERWAYGQNS